MLIVKQLKMYYLILILVILKPILLNNNARVRARSSVRNNPIVCFVG